MKTACSDFMAGIATGLIWTLPPFVCAVGVAEVLVNRPPAPVVAIAPVIRPHLGLVTIAPVPEGGMGALEVPGSFHAAWEQHKAALAAQNSEESKAAR